MISPTRWALFSNLVRAVNFIRDRIPTCSLRVPKGQHIAVRDARLQISGACDPKRGSYAGNAYFGEIGQNTQTSFNEGAS